MITDKELLSLGFEYDGVDWKKENITISVYDEEVTFIREGDNYHGLSVFIPTMRELRMFLSYLK